MSAPGNNRPPRSILFLDVATRSGWCEGTPGEKPQHGSHRFAPEGSSPEAVAAGAIKWLGQRLAAFKPNVIVVEAPLDPRVMGRKTNINTAQLLLGLPLVLGGVAHLSGVYDFRSARADDARMHLLGYRPKRDDAKRVIIDRITALGFTPQDDNAADAICGWLFACSIVEPKVAALSTPLFGDKRRSGF